MSLTLGLWITFFGALAVLSLRRPAWSVGVYLLTYFACPSIWWWGTPVETIRWNLIGGLILLGSVLLAPLFGPRTAPFTTGGKWVIGLSLAMLANATFVHFCLADSLRVSSVSYLLQAKFVLLFVLIACSIRTRSDLRIVLLTIIVGAAYIGYEVTFNERGGIRGNRLEGVGAPNATGANELASLIVTILPLTGVLLVAGTTFDRIAALLTAPLILNVALLCNSRGAFLAAIGSAVALLIMSPSRIRKQAFKVLALGGVAVWLMLGDPRIIDRFMTSFVDAEERDSSAADRLLYWQAGANLIQDYPFGTGGHGFKRVHGPRYIAELGPQFDVRSVHNGYINEACEWGLQGLALRMAVIAVSIGVLLATCRSAVRSERNGDAMACATMIAAYTAFLGSCVFGDRLDAEWGLWLSALALGLSRVIAAETGETSMEDWADSEDTEPHDETEFPEADRRVA